MGAKRQTRAASRNQRRASRVRRSKGGRLHFTRLGHSLRKALYRHSKSNKDKYVANNRAKQILKRLKADGHDVPFSIYDKFDARTPEFVEEYERSNASQARDPLASEIESPIDLGIPQEVWEQICKRKDDKVCAILKGKLRNYLDRLYTIIVLDKRPLNAVNKEHISREIRKGFQKLTFLEKSLAKLAQRKNPAKFLLPAEFQDNAKAVFAHRLVFEMFGWSLPRSGGNRDLVTICRHPKMVFAP